MLRKLMMTLGICTAVTLVAGCGTNAACEAAREAAEDCGMEWDDSDLEDCEDDTDRCDDEDIDRVADFFDCYGANECSLDAAASGCAAFLASVSDDCIEDVTN